MIITTNHTKEYKMNNELIKNITSHSFNVEVANVVGVNAAIIFSNISHWCKVNESNKTNFYDNEYWTYNSISSFIELFPYLSKKQIMSSLDKLKEHGFIDAAEYNKNPYDRTKWYCDLTRKDGLIMFLSSVPKGEMDITKRGNVHLPKRDNSITDNKLTDINTDNKHLNINDELKNSSRFQKDLFGDKEIANISIVKSELKSKANPAHVLIKKFWFEDFKNGSVWRSSDGKFINYIIQNIEAEFKKRETDFDEIKVLDFFKFICYGSRKLTGNYFPHFGLNNFSVPSEFDKLIEIIEKNGKLPTTKQPGQRAGVTNFRFNVPTP